MLPTPPGELLVSWSLVLGSTSSGLELENIPPASPTAMGKYQLTNIGVRRAWDVATAFQLLDTSFLGKCREQEPGVGRGWALKRRGKRTAGLSSQAVPEGPGQMGTLGVSSLLSP